jgi:hypothetical protein
MAANQRPDSGAVDGRYGAQVDDEMAVPGPIQLPEMAFESLRWPPGDKRLQRRKHETITDGSDSHSRSNANNLPRRGM